MKINENVVTCNVCKKRESCKSLCEGMERAVKNLKSENGLYAESTVNMKSRQFEDRIFYSSGMSDIEKRDSRRIIVALLSPEQKELLALYAKGFKQQEIADKLGLGQSGVSQRIKTIKRTLKEGFTEIIEAIV
jgi:DNA-binding NarL/FixJ family response regulator